MNDDIDTSAKASKQPRPITMMVGIAQLATMAVGFGAMAYSMGEKSQQITAAQRDIDTLALIVNDLARTQVTAAVSGATTTATLEEIKRRLTVLEQRTR